MSETNFSRSGTLDFNATEKAFSKKSTAELKHAARMFGLLNHSILGPLGKWALKTAIGLGLPIKPIIRATLYKQFVGGETLEDCLPTAERMAAQGVYSILDYSEEGRGSEEDYTHAFTELKKNLHFSAQHTVTPLTVFKLTAFTGSTILSKVSAGENLTTEEEKSWQLSCQRFFELMEIAHSNELPVMIDAEESWLQPAIDGLAEEAMRKFNRNKAIVINTFQLYRKDKLAYLQTQIDTARKSGFHVGAKLVRGAYMEKEAARAAAKGISSPIQPDKASSDRDYNAAVQLCLDNLDIVAVVIGTHNEESNRKAAGYMDNKSIDRGDKRVWFSQLLGMSDHISFSLANAGFNVAKYVPYGPVKSVTPYLIRRADENSSVAGQAKHELALLRKEIRRRKSNK